MDDFFIGDEEVLSEFRGAFRRHHIFKNICYLRLNVRNVQDWKNIELKLINNFGYSKYKLFLLKPSIIRPVLYLMFQVYRVINKLNRLIVREIRKI